MAAFGITFKQYNEMLLEQGGVCAICGKVNDNGQRLGVDHNHTTGEIRKLLCRNCNTVIGHCKEDVDILNKVAMYLIRYNFTPEMRELIQQREEYSPG